MHLITAIYNYNSGQYKYNARDTVEAKWSIWQKQTVATFGLNTAK